MDNYNISFAGAGRVGSALCREFYGKGLKIDLIVSATEVNGNMLADECKSKWSEQLIFPCTTDIIFVAVPDHKIENVLENIKCSAETIVAHTAGSLGLEVFPAHLSRRAVFYPLQTFTKGRDMSFKGLPVFLESNDQKALGVLTKISNLIESSAYYISSDQRKKLHLAAVFVCNFTNHLLTLGKEIVSETDLDFKVLEPLINETILKALSVGPEHAQTGPAIRNDMNTIKRQFDLLSFSPELQKIYSEMTESIVNYYMKKN